jgi:hypothetical protein
MAENFEARAAEVDVELLRKQEEANYRLESAREAHERLWMHKYQRPDSEMPSLNYAKCFLQ